MQLAQLKRLRKVCWVKLQSFSVRVKNRNKFLLNQSNIFVREYTLLLLFVHFTLPISLIPFGSPTFSLKNKPKTNKKKKLDKILESN